MLKIFEFGNMGMCNKLFFLLHVVASAHTRGFIVELHGFHKFEGIMFGNNDISNIVISSKRKNKVILKILVALSIFSSRIIKSHTREDAINIFLNYTTKDIFKRKDIFFFGWPYLDYYAVRENVALMREYFKFSPKIMNESRRMINRENGDFIVGVHLRRGDYKLWNNGKYYFNDNVYKNILDSVFCQVENRYKFKAIIFSNDEIDENFWSKSFDFPVSISCSSSIMELCMLSLCDLIIGPPSTYSGWASFIGNTPKYNIMSSSDSFHFDKTFICFYDKDGFGNDIDDIFAYY